jgi:hypothetical protein
VITPGTYIVTVSNGFGCTAISDAVEVVQVPLPNPTITFSGVDLLSQQTWSGYQWMFSGVLIPGAVLPSHEPLQSGNYQLMVTDSNGCQGFSNILNVQVVGVTDEWVGEYGLQLFPNPARSEFKLRSIKPIDWNLSVTITNLYGQVVKQYQMAHLIQETGFDISELSAGTYHVQILTEKQQRVTLKLVVQ